MLKSSIFLLSWDCQGLESVINVSDYEKQQVWAKLQDQTGPNLHGIVSTMILRARFNPQRHYEIYTINVEEDITENDLREMFEDDPQGSADLIRDRGHKIFSDRVHPNQVKIT